VNRSSSHVLASPANGLETIRRYCLSIPHVTEDIQWQDDLLFRVGGKIFAILNLEPSSAARLSFKCTPERFSELLECQGIAPAPYVGRYKWVALERFDALSFPELKSLIRDSYEMVFATLSQKTKTSLRAQPQKPRRGKQKRKNRRSR